MIARSPATLRIRRGGGPQEFRHLFRGAYALMTNTVVSGLLGIVFWVVAARAFDVHRVGRDGALIAVMVGVSTVCQLNLGNVFVRFLPTAARPGRLVLRGYLAAAGASLVLATVAVIALPKVSDSFGFLAGNRGLAAVWIASVPLWSLFALQDAALTGLRAAPWVPLENAIFGLLKLALLIPFGRMGLEHGIFLAWVLPMLVLIIPVNVLIVRRAIPGRSPASLAPVLERFGWRRIRRFLMLDYVAFLSLQGLAMTLPIIVVAIVGSAEYAYFYVAFSIVTALDLLSWNAATSLTVEGAFDEANVVRLAKRTARSFGLLVAVGALVLVAAAPLILSLFGSNYATGGATLLRLMALGSIARAVVMLYFAICRARGLGGRIAAVAAVESGFTLALVIVLGTRYGLTGIGLGWVAGHLLASVALLPDMVRQLRRDSGGGPFAPRASA